MTNGGSDWHEIDKLRTIVTGNQARIAVLESKVQSIEGSILASEHRIEAHMDDFQKTITARLDRTRNTALALLAVAVPVISALIGALLQSGGS